MKQTNFKNLMNKPRIKIISISLTVKAPWTWYKYIVQTGDQCNLTDADEVQSISSWQKEIKPVKISFMEIPDYPRCSVGN